MQEKETETNRVSLVYPASRLVRLFYLHAAVASEGAIGHFVDTAKTITLCIKNQQMFGLETNFESTRPLPHHVETKTISLSSGPRPKPRPQKIGLDTYITAAEYGFR